MPSTPCPEQSLSKIEAATRQLHLAILLHFQGGDVIGVHPLAGAAHGILRDLPARAESKKATQWHVKGQRPEHGYVVRMVREAVGFLKHADRDPEGVLRFNPGWSDFLVYDAIRMHVHLTRTVTHPNGIFLFWVTAKYPTGLLFDEILGEGIKELRRLFAGLGNSGIQKRTFLRVLMKPPNSSLGPLIRNRRR